VADAYGWPADLADEAILERLVALNNERAAEEAQGRVRWLRPDYQNPGGATEVAQETLPGAAKAAAAAVTEKLPWPKTLPEQIAAVRAALARQTVPIGAKELKKLFKNAREAKTLEILQALASIGQARETEDGRYLI
jgi:Lon protease-like protein